MQDHLRQLAHEALAARRAAYETIQTLEQIAAYQRQQRQILLAALGAFPEKTPLQAQITGELAGDGYRIEKVLFQSQPGLFVTALLYLPEASPPYPAVLVPCGHSKNGKAYDSYQRVSILLARNGIAALCFDPVGQGERSQVLDQAGQPLQGSTIEHTLIGTGSILLGRNVAADLVWDAIRAIDYLQSRPDIDGSRIGCAGTSGGGTQTSYLMAIEPRIRCSVPCCYLTSLDRLIDTIGPQDAEQNLHAQIRCGLDHADYAILFAPRPLLFGTATRDFFDIQGAWDSFRQAKRIYTRLGFAERVDLVEADLPHNLDRPLRVPLVRWMRRWLCRIDEPLEEREASVRTDADLNCTPQGQVMWLPAAKSLFDQNVAIEAPLAEKRRQFWRNTPQPDALHAVRQLVGVRQMADLPAATMHKETPQPQDACTLTRVTVRAGEAFVLPGILYEPRDASAEASLYLSGDGCQSDPAALDALVRQGHTVLAVDLPGIGHNRTTPDSSSQTEYFGSNWKEFFLSYMLDQSYLGIRVEAALICARLLASHTRQPVHLVATGEAAPAALHAAALEPKCFASVRLHRCLQSWTQVLQTPPIKNQLVHAVHGALKVYDLPDLVATLPAGSCVSTD